MNYVVVNAGFSFISKLGHHAERHKLLHSFGKRQEGLLSEHTRPPDKPCAYENQFL